MSLPPRPRGAAPGRGYGHMAAQASSPAAQFAGGSMGQRSRGYGNLAAQASATASQFAGGSMVEGSEGNVDLGWLENRDLGLIRRRVIPPTDFNAQPSPAPSPSLSQLSQFTFPDAAQGGDEEFSSAMESGGYFTGLMTNGIGLPGHFENEPPAQEVVAQDEVEAIGKGIPKRTKNFTIDEDEQLVRSWLNVSLDPVRGVDQSQNTYWKRIHAHFHANKDFSSDRSQGSLMNRWSSIQHDVNLFAGCLAKIEGRNQSGATIDDKQADALKMFIKVDKKHRQFPFMHCWKLLKDKAKWADRQKQMETQKPASKKQKVQANTSSLSAPALLPATTVDDNPQSSSALQRPPGQKKEKQKLRQHSSIEALDYLLAKKKEADVEKELKKEERYKKVCALQEERIKLEKEKLQLQREQFEFTKTLEEERIMNVDTSQLSTDQLEFYEVLKNEIRANKKPK